MRNKENVISRSVVTPRDAFVVGISFLSLFFLYRRKLKPEPAGLLRQHGLGSIIRATEIPHGLQRTLAVVDARMRICGQSKCIKLVHAAIVWQGRRRMGHASGMGLRNRARNPERTRRHGEQKNRERERQRRLESGDQKAISRTAKVSQPPCSPFGHWKDYTLRGKIDYSSGLTRAPERDATRTVSNGCLGLLLSQRISRRVTGFYVTFAIYDVTGYVVTR